MWAVHWVMFWYCHHVSGALSYVLVLSSCERCSELCSGLVIMWAVQWVVLWSCHHVSGALSYVLVSSSCERCTELCCGLVIMWAVQWVMFWSCHHVSGAVSYVLVLSSCERCSELYSGLIIERCTELCSGLVIMWAVQWVMFWSCHHVSGAVSYVLILSSCERCTELCSSLVIMWAVQWVMFWSRHHRRRYNKHTNLQLSNTRSSTPSLTDAYGTVISAYLRRLKLYNSLDSFFRSRPFDPT
jgi:hypothetical protein